MTAALDIKQFQNRLRADKHKLDEELEIQAESAERIGREVAALARDLTLAKDDMETTESRIVMRLKAVDAKLTNPMAERAAKEHKEYLAARDFYLDAKQVYDEWLNLSFAWRDKGEAMKTLAKLHGQDYFSLTSITGDRSQRSTVDYVARQVVREASASAEASRPRRRPV